MRTKFTIIFLTLLIGILISGCMDQSNNDKYVSLTLWGGLLVKDSGDSFNSYKSEYTRYDEDILVRVKNMDSTLDDGRQIQVIITDYDIYKPTKYVIKTSGHIKFIGDQSIESVTPSFDMTIRDNTGNIIGSNDQFEIEIVNGETVPFTTQTLLKN